MVLGLASRQLAPHCLGPLQPLQLQKHFHPNTATVQSRTPGQVPQCFHGPTLQNVHCVSELGCTCTAPA